MRTCSSMKGTVFASVLAAATALASLPALAQTVRPEPQRVAQPASLPGLGAPVDFELRVASQPLALIQASDGTIWFTDPSYGVGGEGYEGVREMEGCHVYRADPVTGDVRQMTSDFYMPNGLAFSSDESILYIVDTGATNFPDAPNHVRRFAVGPDGTLSGGEELLAIAKFHDGLRVDSEGRLWCANEEGVHCHAPDGTLLGKLHLPERASNLTFGGQSGNWLLITATTSVYRVPVNARAASYP